MRFMYSCHLFPITFPQVKHRTGMIMAAALQINVR